MGNKTTQRLYEEALHSILNAKSLETAKEIAADVLDIEVDEFLVDEIDLDSADSEFLDEFEEEMNGTDQWQQ